MKKSLSLLLVAVMVLALCAGLVGCGGSSTGNAAPSGAPSSDAQPSAAAGAGSEGEDEYYEFSLSMHDATTTPNAIYFQSWADAVSAATDGHVKITIYGSGTLAAASDVADMVKAGGVDIGWLYTSYYAGQFPLTDVINLPMQGFGDPIVSTNVLWSLYNDNKQVQDEWSAYKLLFLYGNPGMIFASADTPITTVADLKGRTVRCPSGAITDVMTAWGASPITMAPPDIYEAIEKNNISAYIFEPSGITNFSLEDVTHYYTDMQMYDGPFSLIMNWDKWNSLPAKYQEAIESLSGWDASLDAAGAFASAVEKAREDILASGGEFVEVSDEAKAEFQVAADAYAETWASGIKAEGLDAAAYLAQAKELATQYSK